jgi:tight adherence protein B
MLPALIVFVVVSGAIFGLYTLIMHVPGILARRRLQQRILDITEPASVADDDRTVIKQREDGPLPDFDRLVSRTNAGSRLAKLVEQSGLQTTPGAIVILTLLVGGLAAVITAFFVKNLAFAVVAAIIAGSAPILYIMNRRSARMRQFEEQFPEALDLLSRALRAGHAFQTALGMIGEEVKAPVGPEFRKTFDQQNFGLPLRDALNQLSERIPILDVRFFVTAVLIQRETGGNLSEILDNLAHVVRERFKILRQVRVHTAHGRFTAFVLLSLPPGLAAAMTALNGDHMAPLFHERMGQTMLLGVIVMQVIGFFWIRKVIKIEV